MVLILSGYLPDQNLNGIALLFLLLLTLAPMPSMILYSYISERKVINELTLYSGKLHDYCRPYFLVAHKEMFENFDPMRIFTEKN